MITNLSNQKNYNFIFVILILSLFLHVRFYTPLVIIRPFDLLTLVIFLFFFFKENKGEQNLSSGFYNLFPYLIIHALLATFISIENFLRETIQVLLVLMFAYIASKVKYKIEFKRIIFYLLIGSAVIMGYVIVWHLSNNVWTGWKRLPDSRILYTVFSVFLFAYLNIVKENEINKVKTYFIFSLFFIILLFSGERKALLVFLFLFLMHYAYGSPFKIIIGLILSYFFILFLSNNIENNYISRMLLSILQIAEPGDVDSIIQGAIPQDIISYSNLQRAYVFDFSKKLILENPFLGVGTNNFVLILKDEFYYLPNSWMQGIHNEFLRVCVENGLFGLILYLIIWIRSWSSSRKILIKAKKDGFINKRQFVFILYSIYVTAVTYVGTEASANRSFIILVFISILPDYLNHYFNSKKTNNIDSSIKVI